ncbi:MAG TPA: S9 family peptidase [Kofleriaceae bacterium]|nr:S9 family peptidase [Kofleriaceae bacterium]
MKAALSVTALAISSVAYAGPPVAKKIAHTYQVAGHDLSDDYAWLKDKDDPDRLAYLKAENDYAQQMLAPSAALAKTLYKEMLGRVQETDEQVPVRIGSYIYVWRTQEGKPYGIWSRHPAAGGSSADEVVLDLNQVGADNKWDVVRLGAHEVSDDGRFLAYTIDSTGGLDYALYVEDLGAGLIVDGPIEHVTSVAWAADGTHLFYTTDRNSAKRTDTLWCHTVGAKKDGRTVLKEPDEHFDLEVARSKDKQWIVVGSGSHTTSEQWLIPAAKPAQAAASVAGRTHDVEYYVVPRGDALFVHSNHAGPTFGVYRAPIATPDRAHWKEVVPVRADVNIDRIDIAKDQLVLVERDKGKLQMRLLDDALASRTVAFPDAAYVLAPDDNEELDEPFYRVRYESLVTPPRTIDVDLATLAQTVRKEQPVKGYDPKKYVMERVSAPAADGTPVPITLVYKKGVKKNGSAPLLLYGYGSYGFPMDPYFDSNRISLLDRGVIYAIAHIRGGGDLGRPWHDAGKMMKKKNTFTDFIAAADWLVAQKYTSRAKLAIEGRSAGGLLIGAVLTMRPDLCKVAMPGVPFVDVVNTMLDESLPLTVSEFEEWGNPKVAAEAEYMLSYSPYDNVKAVAYPAIYVRTGLNDSQVLVHEPAKFVAKLRAMSTGKAPIVMVVNMGAGHAGASNRYDRMHEVSTDWAWMLTQLGIKS